MESYRSFRASSSKGEKSANRTRFFRVNNELRVGLQVGTTANGQRVVGCSVAKDKSWQLGRTEGCNDGSWVVWMDGWDDKWIDGRVDGWDDEGWPVVAIDDM